MDYPRFTGIFRDEPRTNYGFFMEPKAVNGQTLEDLPMVNGEQGGIFLASKVARVTIGGGVRTLKKMDGKRFSFAIRQVVEGKHKGKMEAYDVHRIHGKHPR